MQKAEWLTSLSPLLRDKYPQIRASEKEGGCEEGAFGVHVLISVTIESHTTGMVT